MTEAWARVDAEAVRLEVVPGLEVWVEDHQEGKERRGSEEVETSTKFEIAVGSGCTIEPSTL